MEKKKKKKKQKKRNKNKKKVTDTAAVSTNNRHDTDANTTTIDYPDLSFDSLEDFVSMGTFWSVPSSSSWIFVRSWNIVLASSAWMDFCAATVDSHMRSYLTWETERFDPWLRRHAFQLGMLFSVLWFLDAFVTACSWRRKRLVQAEEEWLSKSSSSGGREKFKRRRVKLQAWLDFAQAVIFQSVLLPVGFYYVLWGHIVLWDNNEIHAEDLDHPKAGQMKTADNTTESFSTTTQSHNISVLVTVLHFFLAASLNRIQKRAVTQGKRGLFHLMRRLLRHPVRAARQIQKFTRWLRWIKVVGPLVGTSNKLLGNAADLLKRARQRAAAQKALRLRKHLWDQMSPEELRHYAATLIQKTYRAARQRKAVRALQLFCLDVERLAAIKLQALFRARLARARYRISHKMAELERLRAKYYLEQQQQRQEQSQLMTEKERRRMYKLKSELTQKAKTYLNKKLLLRPNTTFAVVWKALFVMGVILELSVLVAKALHPKELTVNSILPRLWYDLPECNPKAPGFLHRVLLPFGRGQTSPLVWYCQERAMYYQNMGLCLSEFGIYALILTVQTIYFLDVFITFFTGRFNPQNGMLEPVPAFQRWVAPGMALQLLLNPRMDMVADIVSRLVTSIRVLGPVRVFRWVVAFFFPVFLIFRSRISRVWAVVVASQNKGTDRLSVFG